MPTDRGFQTSGCQPGQHAGLEGERDLVQDERATVSVLRGHREHLDHPRHTLQIRA